MHSAISHASRRPPDVIICRSFTRPSTALAVIEGLETRLIFTKLLQKVEPVWNPVRRWRSEHYNRYITELEVFDETKPGLLPVLYTKPHDCSKATCGGDTCSHTPVSLQSGQLLSEVLYLHLPLLPGNMCLKLLSKINNNSAHHDTMMYTPYQNYKRCQSKYPTLTLILIFIGHLFSLTREQCLKILICASFSSELQITRKVTHIHSSRMKSKTYRLYTNLLSQKFHLCLQVLHM